MPYADPEVQRAYKKRYFQEHKAEQVERQRVRRRERYAGVCGNCGKPTDGSNGREKAPKLCVDCFNAARAPEHGDYTRYNSKAHRCRCNLCRAAWNARMKDYRRRKAAA